MKSHAIILCGGDINYSNLPIGTNLSNSMIPVNGKPVIGWILDDLLEKGIINVTIVLQAKNTKLNDFVTWAYKDRINLSLAFVGGNGTILNSLMSGINTVTGADSIHVILGDTLIKDNADLENDFVFVGKVNDSRNWCLVELDEFNYINGYYDKKKIKEGEMPALAGYYHFTDLVLLKKVLIETLKNNCTELSDFLSLYSHERKIYAKEALEWYDFGHLDKMLFAKRKLLQSRFFNSLTIDPVLGTITKNSIKEEKLQAELEWYQKLPEDLKVLSPRILSTSETSNSVSIKQEYYGYPNLAELYLYGDLDIEIWKVAIDNLFQIHDVLRSYRSVIDRNDVIAMYHTKTKERIDSIGDNEPELQNLLHKDCIRINGVDYQNINNLFDGIAEKIKDLSTETEGCIIHGDYCFSNILYDLNNQIIKLIDPRGSFGKKGIYGDPRYDIAKLRHSVHGLYDYILADLFTLENEEDGYNFKVYTNSNQDDVAEYLDRKIIKAGYKLEDIKLIEGLLFISMVPFHSGKLLRQKAMYLTGIKKLNEVLIYENSCRS